MRYFYNIRSVIFAADLKMLNVPANLLETAKSYIFIIIAGLVVTYLYDACAAALRSLGDSVTPLVILAISVILNIIGDLFFVVILKKWCKRCGNRNGTCTVDCIYCLLDLYDKAI